MSFTSVVNRTGQPRLNVSSSVDTMNSKDTTKLDDFSPAPKMKLHELNEFIVKTKYAVRGPIPMRADELETKLLTDKDSLPFDKIVTANIGNPQQLGQMPLTFIRQVLSILQYPEVLNQFNTDALVEMGLYKRDAILRAKRILKDVGGSVGAYSLSQGVLGIRETIANYIERRDGGEKASAKDIFLTTGASSAVGHLLPMLCTGPETGVLIPIPQYPLYTATLTICNSPALPYYLHEKDNWSINVDEIEKTVIDSLAKGIKPTGMVAINPGNPTGSILTEKDISGMFKVAAKYGIVIIADEVYQENVFEGNTFISMKKVLRNLQRKYKGKFDNVQLASLHSTSKGVIGECGQRGGYMELIGFSDEVLDIVKKLTSISICSVVTGQALMDMVVSPPQRGDASYEQDQAERSLINDTLTTRSNQIYELFTSLEGMECQKPQGALYLFPRLNLPIKAIKEASSLSMPADEFYCRHLLEATGICTVPGSGFGQEPGTYHLRTTFLAPGFDWFENWRKFHEEFYQKYN